MYESVGGDPPAPSDHPSETDAAELLLALVRVAQAERRHLVPARLINAPSSAASLAPRHLAALTQVVLHGPLSVSELTDRLGVALTTTSLLVAQLVETGLLERNEDTSDHRRTIVSVAGARNGEARRLLDIHLQPLRRALARLGPGPAGVLLECLGVLVEELGREPAPGVGARATAPPGDRMSTSRSSPGMRAGNTRPA